MKEKDESKLVETSRLSHESSKSQERLRNTELWNNRKDRSEVNASEKSCDVTKHSKETSGENMHSRNSDSPNSRESTRIDIPNEEKIHSMIDQAWLQRECPGRFDTDGKTAVLWSGYSTSSDHRKGSLGTDKLLYSKDLADHHTSQNNDTHITLGQTTGGKELERIQAWIDSDAVTPAEKEALNKRIEPLWKDASQRFVDSATKNGSSIAYVEHAREKSVYKETERKTIETAKDHRHLTDKPLVDGRPPEEDKTLPGDLDRRGKYYRV